MAKPAIDPINGADRFLISKMVGYQVTQFADNARMLQFWQRLFAGENDPEEIAQGLCLALSGGRYVPKPRAAMGMTVNLTISASGDASPEQISSAVVKALQTQPLSV
jgi:hypothetical protein